MNRLAIEEGQEKPVKLTHLGTSQYNNLGHKILGKYLTYFCREYGCTEASLKDVHYCEKSNYSSPETHQTLTEPLLQNHVVVRFIKFPFKQSITCHVDTYRKNN